MAEPVFDLDAELEKKPFDLDAAGTDPGSRFAQAVPGGAVKGVVGTFNPMTYVRLAGLMGDLALKPYPTMRDLVRGVQEKVSTPEGAGELTGETLASLLPWGGALKAVMPAGAAAALRERGLTNYAKLAETTGGTKEVAEAAETLRPIADELPWVGPINPRKRILNVAEEKLKTAGPAVERELNIEKPSDFTPTIERVKESGREGILYPEHEAQIGTDAAGNPMMEMVSPQYKTPYEETVAAAAQKQAKYLKGAKDKAESFKGGETVSDLWQVRKATDNAIRMAKGEGAYDVGTRELKPEVRALMNQRKGLTETLHDPNLGAGEAGKAADEAFSAWKLAQHIGEAKDTGTFVHRWLAGRFFGGKTGTAAGYVAAQPAFYSSVIGNLERALARAIEKGDKAGFARILRGGAAATAVTDVNESGDTE